MDTQRIWREIREAQSTFALVEEHPTVDGGVYVKAAMQTSAGGTYIVQVQFPDYPNRMPKVVITKPALLSNRPHKYPDESVCYMHPTMWNPGLHNLSFVLARVAKWLNKYEVWRSTGRWVGAEVKH